MKIVVVISSQEPETIWNAFRFAITSLVYENEVTVFLLGQGVEAPTLSTLKFDLDEQMALFRENGGEMIGCGVCCENRKDTMPFLANELNCELGSMQQLCALIAQADKVLNF
jgi:sulfur relay (sulfurtransferase) complex TusBCD TusD component (DsrE family)